ncbi:PAS domain-containing protein [Roseovarius sp. EL26]|uniref:PAS domain-containing protein n=1 Tax=Roseovarius sp. EL26 TaxID=2126672 RepID=UPI0013C432DA|nr:PAS domain-containing protein [Roseovarius sp. EL26]
MRDDLLNAIQDMKQDEDDSPLFRRQLRLMRHYWDSKCEDGQIPKRSMINPQGITSLLGSSFIAEKIAPGMARFRMAGTHLSDLMGMDVRGMPVSSFIAQPDRAQFSDLLVDLFETPASLTFNLRSISKPGAPDLHGRLLLLPLRSDLSDTSRALGCFLTQNQSHRQSIGIYQVQAETGPRRFQITKSNVEPVEIGTGTNLRLITKTATPAVTGKTTATEGERPYLRLVKT